MNTVTMRHLKPPVTMMKSLLLGHMAQGKCVQLDLGVFGCKSDVSQILDERCTGKRTCSLPVDDETLRSTEPCTPGILVYLKATFMCIKSKYFL